MNAKRWYCAETTQQAMPELQGEVFEQKAESELVALLTSAQRKVFNRRVDMNKEMNELRRREEYAAAIEVYKRMVKEGIDPNHHTYTQVLNLYAMLRRPTSAEAVWDKMMLAIEKAAADPEWNVSKAPNALSLPTINAMIHMYCQASNISKALKLYDETMKEWKVKPDTASIVPIMWYFADINVRRFLSPSMTPFQKQVILTFSSLSLYLFETTIFSTNRFDWQPERSIFHFRQIKNGFHGLLCYNSLDIHWRISLESMSSLGIFNHIGCGCC